MPPGTGAAAKADGNLPARKGAALQCGCRSCGPRGQPACRKDSIMEAARAICIGFDVGKSAHRACAVSRASGEMLFNEALEDREGPIDETLALAGEGALVVVDQKRSIGALALERARAAGMEVAYLPGLAMKRARDMFPGAAKTDEMDAEVIARTAIGMPRCLRPAAEDADSGAEVRLPASRRRFPTECSTQSKDRLRSALLEVDPAFEAAVDLGAAWQVGVLSRFGGALGIAAAGRRGHRAFAVKKSGAPEAAAVGLWDAALASAKSGGPHTAAEDAAVRMLAERIAEDLARAASVRESMDAPLADDAVCRAMLAVPGIGPKAASALVAGVDIGLLSSHDKLASFTGLAPSNRRSGTSLDSASSSKAGNKELKNPLVFSCNSLVGADNGFGRYYDACRARGTGRNKALKAVARKRLKVAFAVMRDARPYVRA